jgi:hypothetical protein
MYQNYSKVSSFDDIRASLTGKNDIQVGGSQAMASQMNGLFTRTPGDNEIHVSDTLRAVKLATKELGKDGLVEGKDFRFQGKTDEGKTGVVKSTNTKNIKATDSPKLEFKIKGKWEKGIEIFSNDSKLRVSEDIADLAKGFKPIKGIPYGFDLLPSLNVDDINLMKLQEQAPHKFEGANVLRDNSIQLKHEGRAKDPRDLLEIMVANHVTNGIGKDKDIIDYTKSIAKKDPRIAVKSKNPDDAKIFTPIAKFIIDKGRIPTEEEIIKMGGITAEQPRSIVFASKPDLSLSAFKNMVTAINVLSDRSIGVSSAGSSRVPISIGSSSRKGSISNNNAGSTSIKKILTDTSALSSGRKYSEPSTKIVKDGSTNKSTPKNSISTPRIENYLKVISNDDSSRSSTDKSGNSTDLKNSQSGRSNNSKDSKAPPVLGMVKEAVPEADQLEVVVNLA